MRRVTSADLIRNFSVHSDEALNQPLLITRNGRDRLVMLGIERYREILVAAAGAGAGGTPRRLELERELEFFGAAQE
ncbi:MAG TPA: hypothetical protein VF601_00410 [Beijerinckiaceae bacterium]|jgi:hypothetical protein